MDCTHSCRMSITGDCQFLTLSAVTHSAFRGKNVCNVGGGPNAVLDKRRLADRKQPAKSKSLADNDINT